ncbi:UNVERIFIED_CONTAM: hypothetical protein Sindi_0948500 [Sesamum indicum]
MPSPRSKELNINHVPSSLSSQKDTIIRYKFIDNSPLAQFLTSFYTSLNPRTSDHSPLVLNGDSQQQYGGMFRFNNYLTLSPEFIRSVQQIWQHNIIGVPILVLAKAAKLEQMMLQQRAKMQWMKGETSAPGCFSAIFDIAEDKAPGPDGYSSGFFKAAWPIVGQEVSSAVLDFFSTGRLLKWINTTLLALILKVHSPVTVGEFRPICCCKVLYKIIAKLIIQRLSVILDKLISPCQAAFVPGRSIGDNIMMAQELFTRYNQARLPPRCALKVDIRKAYDTVEWDFMIAVMELFGFPSTFLKWIEACVTTPSFSVVLNGKPHGFFKGARGRRVFQLGFADDLLLLCRADMDSIRVFKTGLNRFADWSGLRLNLQKCHLIISYSAQGLREEMLAEFGLQEGVLPMRHLGLPLLSSRLTIADCRPLLLKIDKRIAGWEGMALSYAGRVQIIKSVLMSLSLYWASAFILPKKVTTEIEKRLRAFLWKGTTTSGYAKVAWCDKTSIWVEWLYQGRLRDTSICTIREHGGSWGWRKILHLWVFLRPMMDYQIGDGRRFYLWLDPWHYLGPLSNTFPWGPRLLGLEESAKLSMVISGGEWQWPPIKDFEYLEITHTLPTIHVGEDRIVWRFEHGLPTTQALYRLFDPPGLKRWRGKHIVNMSYRALLASCVYHIWRERNLRRFEHTERTPNTMALLIVEDIKQRIHSITLPRSVSTRALFRTFSEFDDT